MTFIEIENHIRKTNDLIKLKKDLKNYLICFKTLEEKNEFLDFIELDFLRRHKVKIEKDIELYSEQKVSLFISLGKDAIFKIDCIEKWILENRKETNLIKPLDVVVDKLDFDSEIFKDVESSKLFFHFVNEYATHKSVSQFSQIYHWMRDTDSRIKNNKGVKYRAFVKNKFNIPDKFSRIEEKKPYETPTLNEYYKHFNK